jgi:hypothetical protein
MAEKLEWKADEASALQKVLAKLVNDKDAKVRSNWPARLAS